MLLIHAPPSKRTAYTLGVFFERLIPVPYRVTADANELIGHDGPALSYGGTPIHPAIPHVRAVGLLGETGLGGPQPDAFPWHDALGLFRMGDGASALPFDVFSAAFYLITRYEEYGSDHRDEHGRFLPSGSILGRQGFLRQPVVNQYAAHLRRLLEQAFPRFYWPAPAFSALSTIDVDVAYAYRGRALWRSAAAAARDLLTGDRGPVAERIDVLRGRARDPYDTFDWIADMHARHRVPLTYFVLMSSTGRLDRNIDPRSEAMRELVGRLAEHAEIGLHPSYESNDHPHLLREEIGLLAGMTGESISRSRQHFLKLDLPHTYRRLVQCGITEDYTMGYASEPGFRAGIAAPYPFYDLERDETTDLIVRPLACMDGTLRQYRQMEPDEAIETVEGLIDAVRGSGGEFISLWHNNSLNERGAWEGWRRVFVRTLERMAASGHD